MIRILLIFLLGYPCFGQSPSNFLDGTRAPAAGWVNAGFSIPAYSVPCSTTVSLATGSGAAAANATSIQNALNSCDATHNVVLLPAGTYYVAGFSFGTQGKQVLRGAPTYIYSTTNANCAGDGGGICLIDATQDYSGSSDVLPPSGTRQCLWTAGFSQGTTSITLSSCGGTPPLNQTLILDQANDTSDTSGVYMCDGSTSNCTYEGYRNANGRVISSVLYSEEQVVYITSVTSLGGGSYTVGISPGIENTNIRIGQTPGAWWPGFVQNDGIENMTIDFSQDPTGPSYDLGVTMYNCYQCWEKNVRFIDPARNAVLLIQSAKDVIRDSYFYGAQSHTQTSYNIEADNDSDTLIENNVMQQVTQPVTLNGSTSGMVIDYNFVINSIFVDSTWTWGFFMGHATSNNMNLWEGNIAYTLVGDNASGPSNQVTLYRNFFTGYKPGATNSAEPFIMRALERDENYVGNVLGQPSYHTAYQGYPTNTTTFTTSGAGPLIYDIGAGGTGDVCSLNPPQSTLCDPLTFTTMMRWGNYDVVNAATQWTSSEAAPAANTYVSANFTTGYFNSLAHTLPASLIYSSKPSWWPSAKIWPSIGPDVSTGNVGICTGTYAGWMATNSSQCTGGTLSAAWASHAVSNPAMDCYFNTMAGPTDGSGSALTFNAATCYTSSSSPAAGNGILLGTPL